MASFEDHCEESRKKFGEAFEKVHLWLDEFAGSEKYGYRHRKKRHHEEGVKEVIKLFGSVTGEVARQHIITDLKEEGWTEEDPFPRNEEHYIKIGLY